VSLKLLVEVYGSLLKSEERETDTDTKKQKALYWFVGFGDNLRGRRESVLKSDSPNLSTQTIFSFSRFPSFLQGFESLKPPVV
jgi:hypothetical protein